MKPRVVYMDDEQVLLEIFQAMFEDEFDVRTFDSPEQALEDMQRCEAEIVVSDLSMPGMNGTKFLTEVARICPDSRRIMITGFATAFEMLPEVTSGLVQFFLAKPWSEKQMREVLERAASLLVRR